MNLPEKAFYSLKPDNGIYIFKVRYSGKFKPYNANVRMHDNHLTFNLSRKWRTISEDIRMGLMQELILKILKNKVKFNINKTEQMDLYNIFIKKLHISIAKTKTDPVLEDSFNRVNNKYFFGMIERPNLVWGDKTIRKLGSYEYASDTITISSIFKGQEQELLEYIMYHEALHKKIKFNSKNGRSFHHTGEFRKQEKRFENSNIIEDKIKRMCARKRLLSIFRL